MPGAPGASETRSTTQPRPADAPSPAPPVLALPTTIDAARTLVFVSDRGGQVDIWMQNIETRQLWRLTNDRNVDSFPTWSPDGTRLAYVAEGDGAVRNIWLLDPRTGDRNQLTSEVAPFSVHRIAWLAGGQALVYDTGKAFDRRPDLRVVTITGRVLAPLLPDDGSVIYDWATNGERLVVAVGQPLGEPRIVAVDAVPGARLHQEANAPIGFGVELSADGRYVTYFAPPLSDNQTAWLLTIETGETVPLNEQVVGRRYDHDFSWSPNGAWLAFVHGVGGVTDGDGKLKSNAGPPPMPDPLVGIYMMDRQGGNRVRLTLGSADGAPTWSPDQRWISYLSDGSTPDTSDIWLLEIGSARPTPVNLTRGNGNNWSPAWVPLSAPSGT